MSVNLRHLEAFAAVARLCSFTAAAHLLNVSQPALTVQIRQLEETLTVRLLDRNTRSVRLTRAGEELAPVVERLLAEMDAIVSSAKEMSGKTKGAVRVAALPSIAATLLPRIIVGFRKRYPGVSVMVYDAPAERVVALVRSEHADFGVGTLDVGDSGLAFTLLFRDQMRLVLPVGSPLLRERSIGLADLTGQPLILPGPDSSVRHLVETAFRSMGLSVTPAYEASLMSTVAGMVRAGLGAAILPAAALDMGELAGLRSRPLREPMLVREIGLLLKPGRSLSPAAASFLEAVTASPGILALKNSSHTRDS